MNCLKGFSIIFLLCVYSSIIIAAGMQETSTDGDGTYKINFYGTLTTQEGTSYEVEHITFNKLIKKIILYDKPLNPESFKVISPKVTQLLIDPTKVDFEIRLNAPMKIEIPEPEHLWIFKKSRQNSEHTNEPPRHKLEDDPRAVQYNEIAIIDPNGKRSTFLVERKKYIYATLKDGEIDATKIDVQLPALKVLDIKGYTEEKDDKKKKKVASHTNKKKIKITALNNLKSTRA